MENRSFKILITGVLSMLLLISLVSCSNLPGKVELNLPFQQTDESPDKGGYSENDLITQPETGQDTVIENTYSRDWSEPQPGPTVTAIVLIPEQKGEEGGLIDYPSYQYEDDDYDYDYQMATPVPTAVTEGMADQMTLYRYAPVSGSVVLPNQALHLDVTLQNTGTTVWQTSYKVVDYSDSPMTVQKEYYLPRAVAPGETVLLSIYMTSPSYTGSFPAHFMIQDAYGVVFGYFDYLLTVGEFSSITEIPTLTATVTPTYYSPLGITATPDSLAWMCVDPERSLLQDCYQFCVEYSDRKEFEYCFYDGVRYKTPEP